MQPVQQRQRTLQDVKKISSISILRRKPHKKPDLGDADSKTTGINSYSIPNNRLPIRIYREISDAERKGNHDLQEEILQEEVLQEEVGSATKGG